MLSSVQFSRSVVSDFLWPHGLQHIRLPCPSPSPKAYSNWCPLSQWCHQPSHPWSSPSPPAFNLFQHQGLFQWVSSSDQVAKYWSFSFSINLSNEYHVKCQPGWNISWNQDYQAKYQLPEICRWHHPNVESEEVLKSLLMKVKEQSEKSWLKTQYSKN